MRKKKKNLWLCLLCCFSLSTQAVVSQTTTVIPAAVSQRAAEEAMAVRLTYDMRREAIPTLEYFTLQKEMLKAKVDSMFRDNLAERMKWKVSIDRTYRDSINTVIIPSLINNVSGKNVSSALYWKEALLLDTAQYSTLMEKALELARHLHANPHTDVWDEDIKAITSILDEKQQRRYFHFKNAINVSNDMRKAWRRLADAGLTEQLDSVTAMSQAFDYYHELYRIKDICRNHGRQQRKYIAELDRHKPQMLKMLDALDKQARIDEDEKKTPTVGKEFVW